MHNIQIGDAVKSRRMLSISNQLEFSRLVPWPGSTPGMSMLKSLNHEMLPRSEAEPRRRKRLMHAISGYLTTGPNKDCNENAEQGGSH
jgi:hypothetical protein